MNKIMNSNLDERQEQALLKIEHNGCWLAFWGLLAALLVQQLAFGDGFGRIAGEWVVLIVLSVYMGIACMREGIWDRRLRPDAKTNVVISCITGLVVGGVMFVQVYANHPGKPVGSVAAGVFTALLVGALCFSMLSISAAAYRRRVAELETEPDDEE